MRIRINREVISLHVGGNQPWENLIQRQSNLEISVKIRYYNNEKFFHPFDESYMKQ